MNKLMLLLILFLSSCAVAQVALCPEKDLAFMTTDGGIVILLKDSFSQENHDAGVWKYLDEIREEEGEKEEI